MDINKYTEIIAELGPGHAIRVTFRAQNLNRCFQGQSSMGLLSERLIEFCALDASLFHAIPILEYIIHCEQFHI